MVINHGTRTIKSCAVDVASVFFDVMVVELVTVPDLLVPDVFVVLHVKLPSGPVRPAVHVASA